MEWTELSLPSMEPSSFAFQGVYPFTPATPLCNLADPFSPCNGHNEGELRHGHLLPPVATHSLDPARPPRVSFSNSREHPSQRVRRVTVQGEPSQMDDIHDNSEEDEFEEDTLPLVANDGEVQEIVEVIINRPL